MLAFQGWPNDGMKAVCNSFICILTHPDLGAVLRVPAILIPEHCSSIDRCGNLKCDFDDGENMLTILAIFSTLDILPGNSFVGFAKLNYEGTYNFVCNIILP